MSAALEIKGLEAGYGPLSVLHGIDLSVADGERVGILGLNGHGKTTMLRAIVDLVDWKRGEILLNGEDITHATTHLLARRGLARTFQAPLVPPSLTVGETLEVGRTAFSPRVVQCAARFEF